MDQFTAKEPGKWTWQYRCIINMIKRGYKIVQIDNVEVNQYIENGVYETLCAQLGKEAADACREHADLIDVRNDMVLYRDMRSREHLEEHIRPSTLNDVKTLLDQGYLLMSSLNSNVLNDKNGYSSHTVLVYDMDAEHVFMHDSSFGPERKVTLEKFVQASTDPTSDQWMITACKKYDVS